MLPEPTIAAIAARAIVLAAAHHGRSPPQLCAEVGLDPALLTDIDGRVSIDVMLALWSAIEPLDPDFGLHLAETMLAAQPALPWHLMRASATLGEGLQRLVAAWRVFNDLHPPELVLPGGAEPASEGALLMRTRGTPHPCPRHAAEMAFGWFVVAARAATGVALCPSRMTFEHPAPASTAEHQRIFRCELVFDAPATSVVLSRAAFELPTTGGGDPELIALLEKHAAALLAKLPPRDAFSARVRAAIAPLLAGGDVSVDRVAAALGASPRSVQRHLHDESTSFQRVLDDLRREIATAYLAEKTHPIAEVAILLGFSDQASFHRAFVRWTGRTPGEVRRTSAGR